MPLAGGAEWEDSAAKIFRASDKEAAIGFSKNKATPCLRQVSATDGLNPGGTQANIPSGRAVWMSSSVESKNGASNPMPCTIFFNEVFLIGNADDFNLREIFQNGQSEWTNGKAPFCPNRSPRYVFLSLSHSKRFLKTFFESQRID